MKKLFDYFESFLVVVVTAAMVVWSIYSINAHSTRLSKDTARWNLPVAQETADRTHPSSELTLDELEPGDPFIMVPVVNPIAANREILAELQTQHERLHVTLERSGDISEPPLPSLDLHPLELPSLEFHSITPPSIEFHSLELPSPPLESPSDIEVVVAEAVVTEVIVTEVAATEAAMAEVIVIEADAPEATPELIHELAPERNFFDATILSETAETNLSVLSTETDTTEWWSLPAPVPVAIPVPRLTVEVAVRPRFDVSEILDGDPAEPTENPLGDTASVPNLFRTVSRETEITEPTDSSPPLVSPPLMSPSVIDSFEVVELDELPEVLESAPEPLTGLFTESPGPIEQGIGDSNAVTSGSSVWIISTEGNPERYGTDPNALRYWRLENDRFVCESFEPFQAEGVAPIPTIILIHGNRADMPTAVSYGMTVKNRLDQIQATYNTGPYRLIVWKWDAERAAVNIRLDSQYKAELADQRGFALAGFLNQIGADTPVTLIGFSFGARTIGSATQLLAGGSMYGYALPSASLSGDAPTQINAILLAAATNRGDFFPNGKYGIGTSQIRHLVNVYNPMDKALKFYPLLYIGSRAEALGTAPLATGWLPTHLQPTTLSINSSGYGGEHRFVNLLAAIPDLVLTDSIFAGIHTVE